MTRAATTTATTSASITSDVKNRRIHAPGSPDLIYFDGGDGMSVHRAFVGRIVGRRACLVDRRMPRVSSNPAILGDARQKLLPPPACAGRVFGSCRAIASESARALAA